MPCRETIGILNAGSNPELFRLANDTISILKPLQPWSVPGLPSPSASIQHQASKCAKEAFDLSITAAQNGFDFCDESISLNDRLVLDSTNEIQHREYFGDMHELAKRCVKNAKLVLSSFRAVRVSILEMILDVRREPTRFVRDRAKLNELDKIALALEAFDDHIGLYVSFWDYMTMNHKTQEIRVAYLVESCNSMRRAGALKTWKTLRGRYISYIRMINVVLNGNTYQATNLKDPGLHWQVQEFAGAFDAAMDAAQDGYKNVSGALIRARYITDPQTGESQRDAYVKEMRDISKAGVEVLQNMLKIFQGVELGIEKALERIEPQEVSAPESELLEMNLLLLGYTNLSVDLWTEKYMEAQSQSFKVLAQARSLTDDRIYTLIQTWEDLKMWYANNIAKMQRFRDEYPEVFGVSLDAESSSSNGYDWEEIDRNPNSVPFWHAILDDFVERRRGRHRDANLDQREHPMKFLGARCSIFCSTTTDGQIWM